MTLDGDRCAGDLSQPEVLPGFEELTPDWLDEASFHQAVDMSSSIDELVATLGWQDREAVERALDALDVRGRLEDGREEVTADA